LLAGRLTIAVKPIILENLLVIEDGIYTPYWYAGFLLNRSRDSLESVSSGQLKASTRPGALPKLIIRMN